MAPKRKRAGDVTVTETTTTRATRSSARSKTKTAAADSPAAGTSVSAMSKDEDIEEIETPVKKTRKTVTKTKAATTTKRGTKKEQAIPEADAQPAPNGKQSPSDSAKEVTSKPVAKPTTRKGSNANPEPYSPGRALELFKSYANQDDCDVIGPGGFERLCNDAGIAMDGAAPLLLAWQLGTSEFGKIKKSEWETGTGELRISSVDVFSVALRELEDMLLLDKPALKPALAPIGSKKTAMPEPYNRARYYRYAQDKKKAYNELYLFCFMLAKPETSRSIDMETGCAFWSVLVAPKYSTMKDILEFITEKGTYKGVNKDLWTMTLEFCQTISPNLDGYDADGAWPTMLDEFVNWKRKKIEDVKS
ncbi:unnamed protein product [Somion occarium]|uniref:Defective in cullin neddylation protein n=1 Tax=Somion occarium TaxID=3059160 RepID=A0ABP1D6G9_9APHY